MRYWPIANKLKKQFFAEEIFEILAIVDDLKTLKFVIAKIFLWMARSCGYQNLQIFKFFVNYLEKTWLINLVCFYKDRFYSTVVPIFVYLEHHHWSEKIRIFLARYNNALRNLNPELFETYKKDPKNPM